MTPLSKQLEHLYNCPWVVVDPWSYQHVPKKIDPDVLTYVENVNNYYAHMIHAYIKTHNINNVYVINDHKIPTHRLFENCAKWPSSSHTKDIVFVGFHAGHCIKDKGTGRNREQGYVKADLTCVLPENWTTANSVEELKYNFNYRHTNYQQDVIVI